MLAMTEGEIIFIRPLAPTERPILGVTVAVTSLDSARRVLAASGIQPVACAVDSLWVVAHGVWLEFRQTPR
jgi:hypothetical protein